MITQRTLAKLGNRTRYGYIVSASSTIYDEDHNPLVRAGDKAWCDVCKGTFEINATYTGLLEAGFIAGSGDLVLCHCKDNFVIAISGFTGERHPGIMSAKATAAAIPPAHQAQQEPEQHAQAVKKKTGTDAGFAVLPYGGTTEVWQRLLFTGIPPAGATELFSLLNGPDERYKAGSIMLLVDPDKQDDEQIAHMQAAKARVDAALAPLTDEEANFLHKHYATIANFTSYAETGIGLASDSVGKYFASIERVLKDIQDTYKNTFLTRGSLISEQFYVRRSQLFKELESILKVSFLNKGMKFGEYKKIKNALSLSSSSITHKWNETGISDIKGYATHIERAAKYVKAMRYTGYVGIGFGGLHSLNEIHEACSVGREAECTRKKYTEIGSFAMGTTGSILAGGYALKLCVAIGAGTAGVGGLVCTVIAGIGLGFAGSTAGSVVGELGGEQLYDVFGN